MEPDLIRSGQHEARREAHDLFVYRYRAGECTAKDVATLAECEIPVWPGLAHIYSISIFEENVSILGGAIPEAVRLYKSSPPRTSAFVTRAFVIRTTMEFFLRTTRAVGITADTRFFKDEPSARAWLERRRAGRPSVA